MIHAKCTDSGLNVTKAYHDRVILGFLFGEGSVLGCDRAITYGQRKFKLDYNLTVTSELNKAREVV